jgi:hypothetical protein
MHAYVYELPTTGSISFSDFCTDVTPGKLHTTHISDATQARANLRSELKESKRAERGERDYLNIVKVADVRFLLRERATKPLTGPFLFNRRLLMITSHNYEEL